MMDTNTIARACSASALSHREEDGDYSGLLVTLNDDWRVIVCRDGIQWILQKRRGKGSNRFAAVSYCRRRDGLVRCIGERCGEVHPFALDLIRALPMLIAEVRP